MPDFTYTHVGFFPDQDSAKRTGEKMRAELQATRVWVGSPGRTKHWELHVEREIDMADLSQAHAQARELVVKGGGTYDGGFTAKWPTP